MSGAWSWPTHAEPREPFAEPCLVADPERSRWAATIDAVEAGLAAPDELLEQAGRLGLLDRLPQAEGEASPIPERLPSEQDLVRVATEHDPGVVGSAPDLVLGPWADLADRHARLVAVAWGALFPGDGWDTSPASRWLRSKPGPPHAVRPGLAAILRAPPAVWRIAALHGERLEVHDLLGLGAPAGPIRLRPPATPIGPPQVGGWLMARLVETTGGWEAVIPIVVPARPPVLARWIRWAALYARAVHPESAGRTRGAVRTVADLLRTRGHHLARRLLESAWTADR